MRGGEGSYMCVYQQCKMLHTSPHLEISNPIKPTAIHSCDAFFSLNDCNMIIEDKEYANWSFLFKYPYKYLLMLKPECIHIHNHLHRNASWLMCPLSPGSQE